MGSVAANPGSSNLSKVRGSLCSALGTGNWGAGTGQQLLLPFAEDAAVDHCISLTRGESWKSLFMLAFKGFYLKSTSAVSAPLTQTRPELESGSSTA